MEAPKVTFSFGQNWKDYLTTVSVDEIERAKDDIESWLGKDFILGKSVVDIGCGSGIHSLAFCLLGAASLVSFDFDKNSVDATMSLWRAESRPKQWNVSQGSILDKRFVENINCKFDIVYSWGVLHHTGAMWEAIGNALSLVKPGGIFWISLYAKGPRYTQDLSLKRQYNSASNLGKRWMIYKAIWKLMLRRIKRLQNPFKWNEKKVRGMNVYHDIIDWLGGLPYEVASENEVLSFCRKRGLVLEKIKVKGEGGCNVYLFSMSADNGDLSLSPGTT